MAAASKRTDKVKKSKAAPVVAAETPVAAVAVVEETVKVTKTKKAKRSAEDDAEAPVPAKKSKKAKTTVVVVEEKMEAEVVVEAPVKKSKKSKTAGAAAPVPEAEAMDVDEAPAPAPSKKSKKAKAPEPVEEEEDEDTHLHGFSTDDADSSDDEDDKVDHTLVGIDVSKLPTIAKDDEAVKRKLEKAKRVPTSDRGVLYLGRIPHGFFEDQIKAYFGQFGELTRVRLSRNKKTGASKHYAFLEFSSSSVAQIVADTMDNYLLTGHILRCKVIPKEEVHSELWVGANKKWRVVPRDRVVREEHNKIRTGDQMASAEKRLLQRQSKKKKKLTEAGIDYEFDDVAYKKQKPVAVDA